MCESIIFVWFFFVSGVENMLMLSTQVLWQSCYKCFTTKMRCRPKLSHYMVHLVPCITLRVCRQSWKYVETWLKWTDPNMTVRISGVSTYSYGGILPVWRLQGAGQMVALQWKRSLINPQNTPSENITLSISYATVSGSKLTWSWPNSTMGGSRSIALTRTLILN